MTSSPRGEVTLQIGTPLILTCEVLGLPSDVNSGLLVQWMKRGSGGPDGVTAGGVEVPTLLDLTLFSLRLEFKDVKRILVQGLHTA